MGFFLSLESFYIEKTNTISVKLAILVLIGQLVSTVVVVGMYHAKMKLNQEAQNYSRNLGCTLSTSLKRARVKLLS